MLLNAFDIIQVDENNYELVSGSEIIQIEFDEGAQDRDILQHVANSKNVSFATLTKDLLEKFPKKHVYEFVLKLRDANLLYISDEDYEKKDISNAISLVQYRQHRQETISANTLGLVGTKKYHQIFCSYETFSDVNFLDATDLPSVDIVRQFISDNDFLVVDATSYSPGLLEDINVEALALGTPWLLFQGYVGSRYAHIGPLFYGRENGCYRCFTNRLRSNVNSLESFDRHRLWLSQEKRVSTPCHLPSFALDHLLASIVVEESERFLVNDDIPLSHGNLVEFDLKNYSTTSHRLLPIPMCDICYKPRENRMSPWLGSITLDG